MPDWDSIYSLQPLDNGDGYRVYTADDSVYESRELDEMEARIYGDEDCWAVTLRIPVEELEDGWRHFRDIADSVEDAYEEALSVPQRVFYEDVRDEECFVSSGEAMTLRFNADHRADIASSEASRKVGKAGMYSEYAATGGIPGSTVFGGIGAAAGFLLGGPPGAAAGGSIGGLLGGVGGTAAKANDENYRQRKRNRRKKQKWADRFDRLRRWKYVREGIQEESLLHDLNRRNALDEILTERKTFDTAGNKELDRLEEKDLDGMMSTLTDINFTKFDKLQGVTLSYEAESYGEATELVETVTGTAIDQERPSIFSDAAAFTEIVDQLIYTETYQDGTEEQRLAPTGDALVSAALEDGQEVAPAIDDYLQEQVPATVESHGEELLRGDWDGDA